MGAYLPVRCAQVAERGTHEFFNYALNVNRSLRLAQANTTTAATPPAHVPRRRFSVRGVVPSPYGMEISNQSNNPTTSSAACTLLTPSPTRVNLK